MNKFFQYFSLLLLILIIALFFYKYFEKKVATNIKFNVNYKEILNVVSDSIYHFNILVINKSEISKKYYLRSTCGCTILKNNQMLLKSKMQDTIDVAINTYGKTNDYSSNIYLFGEDNKVIDTLVLDIIGF